MSERKKIHATGHDGNVMAGDSGIDAVLAEKNTHAPVKAGYGRLITTVGSLPEIRRKMGEGYEILWCQMCKLIPPGSKGDDNEG